MVVCAHIRPRPRGLHDASVVRFRDEGRLCGDRHRNGSVLAIQSFGGSNRDPAIAPATSSSLGMLGHNSPFQIVVAALHAAAHVTRTVRPEARHALALESSRSYQRMGAGSMGSMGKAAGSAIFRYLVLVITSLD
jgi:hypothetical protein